MKEAIEKINNYYEGTLQLRTANEEIKNYVLKRMKQEKIHVANTTLHKDGVDYLVSSNDFLLKLNKELPSKFIGIVDLTRKLFTQDHLTGKKVYRLTLLFRESPYRVGQRIDYRGEEVQIINISTKHITAKNVKTGKKLFITS